MEAAAKHGLRRLTLVVDAALIVLAMLMATGLHATARPLLPVLQEPPSFEQYAILPYLVLPLFLGLIALFGLHRTFERVWTRSQLLADLAKLHLSAFLVMAVLIFLTQSVVNRSLLGVFLLCSYTLLYTERAVLQFWRSYQHTSGHGRSRLLLVGARSEELSAFVTASNRRPLPPLLVGRVGPGVADAGFSEPLAHLGDLEALEGVLAAGAADEVLFFPPFHQPGPTSPALGTCEALGIPARFAVEMPQPFEVPARIVQVDGQPFISFDPSPTRPEALATKYAFDAVVAFALLLALSPLLTGVALAILLTMGRPIFFRQERAGLFGRKFSMLKFRTMVRDAEAQRAKVEALNEMSGPVFKASRDPRVTRLGRILRRTSIDELPQLLHVLTGSMSLVGPRPLPSREQQGIVGWHRRRLAMKPGITGLWQVSGRNDVDFEQWMRLDLEYVDHWSLGLDFRILLKTLPVVLGGKGAR